MSAMGNPYRPLNNGQFEKTGNLTALAPSFWIESKGSSKFLPRMIMFRTFRHILEHEGIERVPNTLEDLIKQKSHNPAFLSHLAILFGCYEIAENIIAENQNIEHLSEISLGLALAEFRIQKATTGQMPNPSLLHIAFSKAISEIHSPYWLEALFSLSHASYNGSLVTESKFSNLVEKRLCEVSLEGFDFQNLQMRFLERTLDRASFAKWFLDENQEADFNSLSSLKDQALFNNLEYRRRICDQITIFAHAIEAWNIADRSSSLAIKLDPNCPRAHLLRAVTLARMRELQMVERHLEVASKYSELEAPLILRLREEIKMQALSINIRNYTNPLQFSRSIK